MFQVHNETMTQSFDHLGIQCVKKKDIEEALKAREEIRVDPFRSKYRYAYWIVKFISKKETFSRSLIDLETV